MTTLTTRQTLGAATIPLTGDAADYDALIERIGDARLVLLGEASHGTHEFYAERAEITRRLIVEKGFTAVAAEADWPDAWRVNRFVQGDDSDPSPADALAGFRRFPAWMWRNEVVRDFVGWLRVHNEGAMRQRRPCAGFYGLDLYSLHASIEAVIEYLERVDPPASARARECYGCFEYFGNDAEAYGYATSFGIAEPCEDEVVAQLVELRQHAGDYLKRDGVASEDAFFYAEQNARLIANAEAYYRAMFRGSVESWNERDRHMAGSLEALLAHLGRRGDPPRVVVWAHNSHLGDARATGMGAMGELNLGQLVRQRHAGESCLVGFTTFTGSVTAASEWGGPAECKRVRPALPGSVELLFHETDLPRFMLPLGDDTGPAGAYLAEPLLERAIGVIYRPKTERQSHYFHARLLEQFDVVIHFDRTRAVRPLEISSIWEPGELPETYPTAQ